MIIGEEIREFRYRSFFMSGCLVSRFLVLFFKFSKTDWVSIDIGEGVLRILPVGSEPQLLGLSDISDEFAYPIQRSGELDKYFGKSLSALHKYVISGVEYGCVGVYFDFGGSGFSVIESDDNLSIIEGIVIFSDEVVLSALKVFAPFQWVDL